MVKLTQRRRRSYVRIRAREVIVEILDALLQGTERRVSVLLIQLQPFVQFLEVIGEIPSLFKAGFVVLLIFLSGEYD